MITAVFVFFFVLSAVGIALSVATAINRTKNRGWEPPAAFLLREVLCLAATLLIFWGFQREYLSEFASLIMLGFVGGTLGGYLVWNDRKYALQNGKNWRFL